MTVFLNPNAKSLLKNKNMESTTANCKTSTTTADEIVSDLKMATKIFQQYSMLENIDFLGCSGGYCIEKINALENALKYLKRNIRLLDK